jgi:chromate transporter
MAFALGMRRAGITGALAASFCFTLPSAVLMVLFAYGVAGLGNLHHAGWLHGLKLAAVAVVAQAVWGMWRSLCPDPARKILSLAAAVLVTTCPGAPAQIGSIVIGAMIGWLWHRKGVPAGTAPARARSGSHLAAATCFLLYFLLLFLLPALAASAKSLAVSAFDSFYRSGALVFGGGHVVLPLLRAEVVPRGWVNDDSFLAGYGAAQALPGPLFTFAAYLGAAMHPGPQAWLWGLWCLLGIFLPAWLILGGALPFWEALRAKIWMQAALRGTNAAVVGVLLAALYNPVIVTGVRNLWDVLLAGAAFYALEYRKAPPWLVVIVMAAVGQLSASSG